MIEENVVEFPGLCVIPQFEVAEGQVKETFSPSLWRVAKDVREQANAFLLLATGRRLDQALKAVVKRMTSLL